MASGIGCDEGVIDEYDNMKKGKMYRFITMKIKDEKKIFVDETFSDIAMDPKDAYEQLVQRFSKAAEDKQCLYAIFDLAFDLGESGKRNKLVLILWAPAEATVKQRMLYSSSKDNLKKKLHQGIGHELQANDMDDLDYEDLRKAVSQGKAI